MPRIRYASGSRMWWSKNSQPSSCWLRISCCIFCRSIANLQSTARPSRRVVDAHIRREHTRPVKSQAGARIEMALAQSRQPGERGQPGVRYLQALIELDLLERLHPAEDLQAA